MNLPSFLTGGSSFPHPHSPAGRHLTPQQIEKHFAPKSFGVIDIPRVMHEKEHWPMSAKLMNLWLNAPAKKMTIAEKTGDVKASNYPTRYVSTDLFTIVWLLKFKTASDGYASLKKNLKTDGAINKIRQIVKAQKNLFGSSCIQISNSLLPVELHTNWQFQFQPVGFSFSEGLDDLYGSLGRFAWYAAIVDAIYIGPEKSHKASLQIMKIGVYMRDTFEFLGGQYLGHWNTNGMKIDVSSVIAARLSDEFECHWNLNDNILGEMQPINNSDFNSYRAATRRGGDLMIFSNVRVEDVSLTIEL